MNLLEFVPFFSVLLLALLGMGSIGLSLVVWRRRRQALQERSSRFAVLGRLALPLGLLGGLLVVLSLSLRTFFPRKGELFVRDAVVIRADAQRGLPALNPNAEIEGGACLVTFSRPGLAADLRRLRLKERRLDAEAERLRAEPPSLDPALVREAQELVAERRHLTQRRDLLRLEQQRLEEQARIDLLDKLVLRHEIRVQLDQYDGQLVRMESQLAFEKVRLESAQGMHKVDALSEVNFAERKMNIDVVRADIVRLRKEQQNKRALLTELSKGIETLKATIARHESLVAAGNEHLETELLALERRSMALAKRQVKDRERVLRSRETELRELEFRRKESLQEIARLEDESQVISPKSGRLLYRHPSPQSAKTGEPLLLFGPGNAIRARFRLPAGEARRLQDEGEIELLASSHELLEHRLSGRFVSQLAIEHEKGLVVAELECDATPTQLAYLSRGITLDTRLLWAPPLHADPLFLLGAFLILVSLFPALGARLAQRRPARMRLRHHPIDVRPNVESLSKSG